MLGRGEGIRTPGPMLPKHVRYQTALHPVSIMPMQATKNILHNPRFIVKGFI